MNEQIPGQPGGATLVGGGPFSAEDLRAALCIAPFLVAADGGADGAIDVGVVPDRVIGDLDSISDAARRRIGPAQITNDPDQDSTDFEKCLARIDAPLILGLGFLGGQVDHELAALGTLVRQGARRIVLIGARDVIVHLPGAVDLTLEPGMRLSLFPLAPVTGRSGGLDWPIDGIDFAPWGRGGTSNRVTAGPVRLAFDGAGMLLILPRRALLPLLAGLR